ETLSFDPKEPHRDPVRFFFSMPHPMSELVQKILFWYENNKRTLPWRDTGDPYKVLLSEVMLQQTRIEAVKKYFLNFIRVLPDIKALAECDEETLLKLWEGLGYYSRARNLKKAAEKILEKGFFPETQEELSALPGIGRYTAGAISSIAFGRKACAVDGNVLRVLSRYRGKDVTKEEAEEFLLKHFPAEGRQASNYTQAWMELGETLCLPKGETLCSVCPLKNTCIAKKKGIVELLPSPKEKKPRKTELLTVLLLEHDQHFGIRKRPAKGLLASLWEFPSLEGFLTEEEVKKSPFLPREAGIKEIRFLYETSHVFTHVKWEMRCYRLLLRKRFPSLEWVTPEEMGKAYPLPSAFAKMKKSACNPEAESVY
ncbi:MAG: A/G-specific adenine glycosylase, partial [Lentisphaeria bacterium]|nr:A/G-specific adenine glycosylase [Lentisphaeria bacterium]